MQVDLVAVLYSVDMLLAKNAGGQTLPSRVVSAELLEGLTCASVPEAQVRLEGQCRWYNEEHLHSSLKYVAPAAFARAWRQEQAETKTPC